jgi:hypothetical protein
VILDGDPITLDIENTMLRRVLNTNWDLFQDRRTDRFYLRHKATWLTAPDLDSKFVEAVDVPPALSLKVTSKTTDVKDATTPKVIVVKKPSELIVIHGSPEMVSVAGTQLFWVTNTENDLYFYAGDRSYYFLTSGRWFRSPALQGPWRHATPDLPEDFKRIPASHPNARVLAAVPGTREAVDAVLLAAIPRKAEVNRDENKAEVQYVGSPQFEPIAGTSVVYAVNTPNDILRVGDLYYLCFQGVWFVSPGPKGPWQVADRIPGEIYTIPESSSNIT